MKRPGLFLFTSEFPFGKQETFLESEVAVLCQEFDITLIPRKGLGGAKREVPANVKIDCDLASLFAKRRYKKKYSFLNLFFWRTMFDHLKFIKGTQPIKRIAAFACEYCQTRRYLKNREVNSGDIMYSYWFNGVAYALSETGRGLTVARGHRYDVYEDLYKPSFMVYRQKAIDNLNKIFFISESGLRHVLDRYFGSQKFVLNRLGTFFYGGLRTDTFSAGKLIKLISISNLYLVKRVDVIAGFLIEFSKNHPDFQLNWVHFGDGPERDKIERLLRDMPPNLDARISDRISNRELHENLANNGYDLLINLSSSEGLPVSMMEAISYGIPIVATNVGGISEIVSNTTGILLDPDPSFADFENGLLLIKENMDAGKISRQHIHAIWDIKFNAHKNYKAFADQLMQVHLLSQKG